MKMIKTRISASSLAVLAALLTALPQAWAGLKDYPAATMTPIGVASFGGKILDNADNGEYTNTLATEFNFIGAINDLKMYMWKGWSGDPMTGTPVIDFTYADAVANFARMNSMYMRGHVLVYHQVIPPFLNPSGDNLTSPYTDAEIQHMVQTYIDIVMKRYKDVITEWDVTNEMLAPDGSTRTNWGNNVPDFWYAHLGKQNYFYNIYAWASNSVPTCKRLYCDFRTEYPGPKFDGMLSYLHTLRANGCPIDGVAFQCHENIGEPTNILTKANTDAVDAEGMEWQVSELDVKMTNTTPTQANWNTQNSMYSTICKLCTQDPNCAGLLMWDLTDPTRNIMDTNYTRLSGYYALEWRLAHSFPMPTTNYNLVNVNSGLYMEVTNSSKAEGANVEQAFPNGLNNQLWSFATEAGCVKVINKNSGKCLDVQGASLANGGNVIQDTFTNGVASQLWSLVNLGSGNYKLINLNSAKVLEVAGASTNNHANIRQWQDNGNDCQAWHPL